MTHSPIQLWYIFYQNFGKVYILNSNIYQNCGIMADLDKLFESGKISRINEHELNRYLHFYQVSSNDNLEHCRFVIEKFPRWSMISGYYAMHDATKLFIAKGYRIKINEDVHNTTIKFLTEILNDESLISLFESGYNEYREMAGELHGAREERRRAQYYTGTEFTDDYFRRRARKFLEEVVEPYLDKMAVLEKTL